MKGTTHLALGVSVGAIGMAQIFHSGSIVNGIFFAAGCAVGSLFPDLDHPASKISRHVPILPKVLNFVFGHRGLLHSPLFLLVFSVIAGLFLPKYIVTGFVVGFLSHLFLDMLNPAGIPLLYPVKKRFRILKIPSSSWLQYPMIALFLLIAFLNVAGTGLVFLGFR